MLTIDFDMETKTGKSKYKKLLDHFTRQTYPSADDVLREKEKTIMRKRKIRLLDTVALVRDIPSRKLNRGEVGTVVEIVTTDVYKVEFCDDEGQTNAELALRSNQLIPLHNQGDALRIVA